MSYKACEDPERLPVHLDLLDPSQPKLAVKVANLRREGRVVRYVDDRDDIAEPPNANVHRGCIEEKYGRPLCLLLDALRFLAAKEFVGDENIQSIQDIQRMHAQSRRSDKGKNGPNQSSNKHRQATTAMTTRLNYFLAVAWSHWNDPGDCSVYEVTKKWIIEWKRDMKRKPIPVNPQVAKEFVRLRDMVNFCGPALDHIRAVKSWHIRVHGDFWIVGGDEQGTYLVPRKNEDMVYQCVGLSKSLHETIQSKYGSKPMVWKVTLIPFYGRLVYDGVVTLGGATSHGLAMVANESKSRRLNATVAEAKRNKRVIRRLLQLEVEGGSTEGLTSYGQPNRSDVPKEQPPPSHLEVQLLRSYLSIRNIIPEDDPTGVWVLRRKGYTEHENPDHVGLILGGGEAMGFFNCSNGLQPTSIDILSGILEAAMAAGRRPHAWMPDDYACFHRIKYLFAQTSSGDTSTSIEYYHPPTPEETAAAMISAEVEEKKKQHAPPRKQTFSC
ncbi:MAG: hypothetical protein SGILL_000457 [Bacillariaceae sp.]